MTMKKKKYNARFPPVSHFYSCFISFVLFFVKPFWRSGIMIESTKVDSSLFLISFLMNFLRFDKTIFIVLEGKALIRISNVYYSTSGKDFFFCLISRLVSRKSCRLMRRWAKWPNPFQSLFLEH